MTLDELAIYLRLSKSSLFRIVKKGLVPGQKIGLQWRFHRSAVDLWLGTTGGDLSRTQTPDETEAFFMSGESHDIAEHADLVGKFDVRLNRRMVKPALLCKMLKTTNISRKLWHF